MTKGNVTTMEMRGVSETERPKAIGQFMRNGFLPSEIITIRVKTDHYDMIATRTEK